MWRNGGFYGKVGVHQGSVSSPHFFVAVMDKLTRGVQDRVLWCMMFADDVLLVDANANVLEGKLERWRKIY